MEYIQGDLLQAFKNKEIDYIAHQCNCIVESDRCSGIAQKLFTTYPNLAIENNKTINLYNKNPNLLGNFSYSDNIFNLYSQYYPGSPSKGFDSFACRISYLKEALIDINKNLIEKSIGFPLIASGLAKQKEYQELPDLNYFQKFIAPIIKECSKDMIVKVYYL